VAEPDLAALVHDYSGLLYRVALSLVRNPSEAEDVVQDVFVRVLQRKRELAAIVELRPWLVRIAWNLSLDRRRRVRPDQMDEVFAEGLIAADLPVDEALAEAGRIHRVLGAMDGLPQRERQALLLSAMDELSSAEIAAILGRSESSIRSLLFRARTHLRQRLEN
jgi:RNA polymerase sigma-70 factor (ECF subfamily)